LVSLSPPTTNRRRGPRSESTSRLYYIDDENNNSDGEEGEDGTDAKKKKKVPPGNVALSVPVLGPFPGGVPLAVGSEFVLDAPTPMQWQALEESAYLHRMHLSRRRQRNENDVDENDDVAAGAIEAAPLVAVMDEYTSCAAGNLEPPYQKCRYATIAAVVGVSSSASSIDDDGADDEDNNRRLDLTDESSFMESVWRAGRKAVLPNEGRVRLVGIGRAALHDFFYQVPASVRDAVDEEGHLILEDEKNGGAVDDYEDDYDTDDDSEPVQNIVMAKFHLLTDGQGRSRGFRESSGDRAAFSSPVHALHEMQSLANKIQFMHQDRRHLVAGLKAAELRLKLNRSRTSSGDDGKDYELVDHDGIGTLFGDADLEAVQPAFDKFVADFVAPKRDEQEECRLPPEDGARQHHGGETEEHRVSPLTEKQNYGMGANACSISSITDLTSALTEKLSPYYSPARRESEEHYYEVLSFASVLALDRFVDPYELGWMLRCTNTIERLQRCYESMWEHVRLLREEADVISQELLECGEECTDLW